MSPNAQRAFVCLLLSLCVVGCRSGRERAVEAQGNVTLAQGDKPVPLTITLLEHDGAPLQFTATLVSASRGYPSSLRALPKTFGWTDKAGRVAFHNKIPPGQHIFVARSAWPNATVFHVTVLQSGLDTELKLRPFHYKNGHYPDLDLEVQKKEHDESTMVEVTISNNREADYVLDESDLNICMGGEARVFPPKTQQHVGLRIPPRGHGRKRVILDWSEYVKKGIWVRRREDLDEIWPASSPAEGQVYVSVTVGIARSMPISVPKPGIVLSNRRSD